MPKPRLRKHTMNLREGDYQIISDFYRDREIPAGVVIRKLVSRFVDGLEVETPKDELDDLTPEVNL